MKISKFRIKNSLKYIKYLSAQPNAIKNILGLFLIFTNFSRFIILKKNGYKLRFYPTAIGLNYFNDNNSRNFDEEVLVKYLKEGDTFIDIGANIGALTCKAFSIIGIEGKVIAIEAHPKIFKYLDGNIKLNNFNNILRYQNAIGDFDGEIFFTDNNDDDQNSITKSSDGLRVEIRKLDNLLNNILNIDFLKIDIEGYELFALKGAEELLKRTKIIYLEIGEKTFNKFGYSCKEVFVFLEKLGFDYFKFDQNYNEIQIDINYISQKIENIICIKR